MGSPNPETVSQDTKIQIRLIRSADRSNLDGWADGVVGIAAAAAAVIRINSNSNDDQDPYQRQRQ